MASTESPPSAETGKTAIALVYWGRVGAGAALMSQIAQAMERDPRFTLYLSPSLQSELPPIFPPERLMPVETFEGPLSLLVRSLLLPITVQRLVRRLAQARVAAIVTIMPHVWGAVLQRAVKRAGIETILIVHDADPHPGERRPAIDALTRREIRASHRIVTLSDHVADRLVTRGDVSESRLVRLFHPVFRFAGTETKEAHPAKPFRLLFFGRILPYKGVTMLLDAFAKLRAGGVDCTLRVVGRGEIDAPAALLKQHGLTIETGWVAPDAIGPILAEADAIALPYLEASQSGVVAAAYGVPLPVVATPVGGLREQVIDGETGVLSKSTGAADFAEAIRRLIETPSLYAAARAGAGYYATEHSLERFARYLGDAILKSLE